MTKKNKAFLAGQMEKLPIFFRNNKLIEFNTGKESTPSNDLSYFASEIYHSQFVESSLPEKPTSKIIFHDEQKDF